MKSRRIFFMFSAVIAASLMLSFCAPATTPDTTNPPATDFGPKFTVFVSAAGSDANFGTNKNAPIKSISNAIATASALGFTNIYIAAGTYTPGNGIMSAPYGVEISVNNIHLIGGWNSSYSSISGYSIFDGVYSNYSHVLYISNCQNIQLKNINIRNAFASADGNASLITKASGITLSNLAINNIVSSANYLSYFYYATNIIIKNSSFYNNHNNNSSGVGFVGCSSVKLLSSVMTNNYSTTSLAAQLVIMLNPYTSEVMISNNLFGSTNNSTNSIGVRNFVSNYIFVDNIFVDNSLGYLYRQGTVITNDITAVNSLTYMKASIASGNKLTNF